MSENEENNSNTCVVCYKNVNIYSIGICEHPVCFECSTRMRVLCQQNECPICRQDLPKVVFTKEIKSYRFLRKGSLFDSHYNIYFDDEDIQEKFNMLLANTCNICPEKQTFSTFNSLKDHMRHKHELHFCDLCVENLKIFTHERRCYTRSDLALHRRKGDVDDKSHKGHPLCEFCDQRYMDNDELYRHLRRDHLYCHFCDADGLHQYYSSYDFLRQHFSQEHYLCEEGACAEEKFTSVFRTDIDLKAHKASVHGRQMGKQAAKQARTLELEFTLAPRGDGRNNRRGGGTGPRSNRDYNPDWESREYQDLGAVGGAPAFQTTEEPTYIRQPSVDVQSTQEFPTLGNSTTVIPNITQTKTRGNLTIRSARRPGQVTDEDFPALGSDSSCSSVSKTVNLSVSSSAGSSGISRPQPGSGPNVSIHVNHKSNGTVTTRVSGPNIRIRPSQLHMDADFPALTRSQPNTSSNTAINTTSQWTKVTTTVKPKSDVTSRSKKVVPPPLAPSPPAIQSGEDFPSLQRPSKVEKHSVVTIGQNTSSWGLQSDTSDGVRSTNDATKGKTKKKKIKQNINCVGSSENANVTKKTTAKSSENSDKGTSNNVKFKNEAKTEVMVDVGTSKKDVEQAKKEKKNVQSEESTKSGNSSNNAVVQRKRSELKIDSLNSTNNNIYRSEDFPALGSSVNKSSGIVCPPPGFSSSNPITTPPPGFFTKMHKKPQQLHNDNDLTFTNSSGESYSIVPNDNNKSRTYNYVPPPDFQKRNKNLVANVSEALENEDLINEFRYVSGLFRQGICNAEEYYMRCRTAMGISSFEKIFPELLVLLPDIEKQQELFKVYKKEISGKIRSLETCATCGQILRNSDLKSHLTSHTLENHFPALGIATHSNNTWVRK